MTKIDSKREPDIFLCHSSKDKSLVRRLARDLHELYVYAWFDEWELAPGDSLHSSIGRALEASSYVGVVLTQHTIKSNWCQKELNQALSREDRQSKTVVLPIIVEKIDVPAFLEDKLWVDISVDYFSGLTRLAGHIHQVNLMHLAQVLEIAKPKDVVEARKILQVAGWRNAIHIGPQDWQSLRETLARYAIVLPDDDNISIYSHNTKGYWMAE